jgi:hypothetical protein
VATSNPKDAPMKWLLAQALAVALIIPSSVEAAQPYACGGAALAGGAQLVCSHIDPTAPPQSCNFYWSLMATDDTTSVVEGTFLLEPGTSNAVVYQGFGYNMALANPVILCQSSPK